MVAAINGMSIILVYNDSKRVESAYIGETVEGICHSDAIGIKVYDKGQRRYTGQWKNGKHHGDGTYNNLNGESY